VGSPAPEKNHKYLNARPSSSSRQNYLFSGEVLSENAVNQKLRREGFELDFLGVGGSRR